MFDKLVESNSAEAEFKPRRKFFMVSTVIVGILFLTAVMISLYAQDFDLGAGQFEISELLAPVTPDAPEPEPPRQQPQNQPAESERPTRQANIEQIAQSTLIPEGVSSVPNTQRERPSIAFNIGRYDIDTTSVSGDPNRLPGSGNPIGTGSEVSDSTIADAEPISVPPPIKPKVEKPAIQKTSRVMNGVAINLPKPPYPATAKVMNLSGEVNVQVTIDESGNVISARAVSGHAFFKPEAERAAWKARFKPTLLSDQPVKVTGVIIYKFTRN